MSESAANYTLPLFPDTPPAPAAPVPAKPRRQVSAGSFYNTTGVTGNQLQQYRQQAESQESVILQFFLEHPHSAYTPSELSKLLPRAPLTSIRRAVSDLTREGLLEKTTAQKNGIYNRPEYKWRLHPEPTLRIVT